MRYLFGWVIASLIFAFDVLWLHLTGYSVEVHGIISSARVFAFLACVAGGLVGLAQIPRYRLATKKLRYAELAYTIAWMLLMMFFVQAAAVLSYLSVTLNMPLVDDTLVRFDQSLGFDWPTFYHWVSSHSLVQRGLALAYASGFWQLLAIPLILGLLGRYEDLSDLILHLMLSSVPVILVSTWFPAASAFVHFHITEPNTAATVSDFDLLRNGTMRHFVLARIQGLVSFPSFHSALAVFFAYSLRRVAVIFPCALFLNIMMLISTSTQGGHYLADVFGGLIVAYSTIQVLQHASGGRVGGFHAVWGKYGILAESRDGGSSHSASYRTAKD